MPARATASPWRHISATTPASRRRWPSSPIPTPTRTSGTTRPSRGPAGPAGSTRKRGFRDGGAGCRRPEVERRWMFGSLVAEMCDAYRPYGAGLAGRRDHNQELLRSPDACHELSDPRHLPDDAVLLHLHHLALVAVHGLH